SPFSTLGIEHNSVEGPCDDIEGGWPQGPLPGSPGDDGAPDLETRTDARLRARAADQARLERPPPGRGGLALSRAPAHAQGRLGARAVGRLLERAAGSHLRDHRSGGPAPHPGAVELRADAPGHRARPDAGRTMNWVRQILSRRRLDRDLSDEIREHIEEH